MSFVWSEHSSILQLPCNKLNVIDTETSEDCSNVEGPIPADITYKNCTELDEKNPQYKLT